MQNLKNRTALITGVSRKKGIGFGIAKRLASMGADLFLHSYQPYDKHFSLLNADDTLENIKAELSNYEVRVEQMEADFMDSHAPAQLMKEAVKKFGHIDILILNHTYDSLKNFEDLTSEEIDRHMIINVRASLLLIREFSDQHDGRAGGRIVLLISGQHLGPMSHLAYVASKGALHQLTQSISALTIEKGITVNTVNPGPTKTYTPSGDLDKAVIERMPFSRWSEPDDAARLIAWLVSDDAVWITGQIVNSEGGFRRG